jgi:predicted transcriptional regulator
MAPRKPKLLSPRSIRLDPDVKEVLDALAEAEDRSLSYVINRVLRDYVERLRQDGKVPTPPPKGRR